MRSMFGHPSPSKRQILNATVYAYGPDRPAYVRITSSRLYTTPSVTLRRHSLAASSPSFAHASTTNMQTSTIGDNRPHSPPWRSADSHHPESILSLPAWDACPIYSSHCHWHSPSQT
ncbi:hypothetical protein [Candidatus Reidiella endopervernicosa]|uniref:Uncharacterized protein n=1 Tax=Candidatus Reidiella endopervernicosa TaxID=2738883 RepID=A0A6N0HSB8_9GAMM|nr:hypothetical protein [Candidatus Reidiella endopervernicosa]QKQ25289.1 hypothetical protein HUE57_02525 [Candidatus Reidiella endopervernicosa]